MSVDVEGLSEILAKLSPYMLRDPFKDMYDEIGDELLKAVEQRVQQLTTRRSGKLADSWRDFKLWQYSDLPTGGQIENPIFYGRFVDQGTSRGIKPRRFMRKAVTDTRHDAEGALRKLAVNLERRWR